MLPIIVAAFIFSCNSGVEESPSGEVTTDTEETVTEPETGTDSSPEYTSAYVCPMHCKGSGSSEPGECPECGMEYEKNDAPGQGQ